jgi:hypothetical protein
MKAAAIRTVGKADTERALGMGPSRMRAFLAATVTGTATAALTYRLLRSGPSGSGTRGGEH